MSRFFLIHIVTLMAFLPVHALQKNLFEVQTKVTHSPLALQIQLKVLPPAKINQEAPLSVDIKPEKGVTAQKVKLSREAAEINTPQEISWEVPLRVAGQETYEVNGHLSFYLCTNKWCRKSEAEFTEMFSEQIAPVAH